MTDLLCVGILVADIVARPVVKAPTGGSLLPVDEIGLYPGGCAVNTAIALAKLGVSVGVVGKIGADALGDFLVDALDTAGVRRTGVVRDDATSTSASAILVEPSGERDIIHAYGGNAAFVLEEIDEAVLERVRILHIAGAGLLPAFDGAPTATLLRRAKARGVMTTIDTAGDLAGRAGQNVAACLPFVDLFMPSAVEASAITGSNNVVDQIAYLRGAGARSVIVKLGDRGCEGESEAAHFNIPAFKVRAVDTTGAGDCFSAGVLAGLLQGQTLERAARLGCAVAALGVQSAGATSGVRDLADTTRWMEAATVEALP